MGLGAGHLKMNTFAESPKFYSVLSFSFMLDLGIHIHSTRSTESTTKALEPCCHCHKIIFTLSCLTNSLFLGLGVVVLDLFLAPGIGVLVYVIHVPWLLHDFGVIVFP